MAHNMKAEEGLLASFPLMYPATIFTRVFNHHDEERSLSFENWNEPREGHKVLTCQAPLCVFKQSLAHSSMVHTSLEREESLTFIYFFGYTNHEL